MTRPIEEIVREYNELRLEKIEAEHTAYLDERVERICSIMHYPTHSPKHPGTWTYVDSIESWVQSGGLIIAHVKGDWHGDTENFDSTFPANLLMLKEEEVPAAIKAWVEMLISNTQAAKVVQAEQDRITKIARLEAELRELKS